MPPVLLAVEPGGCAVPWGVTWEHLPKAYPAAEQREACVKSVKSGRAEGEGELRQLLLLPAPRRDLVP